MSELPDGWTDTSFEVVLDYVQRGKSPKYSIQSELPVVNQKCVRWWGIQEEFLKFIRPDQIGTYTEEKFLRKGDVLWNSTGTGTIGRAALFQGLKTATKAVVDGHVTILRSSAAIEPKFLFNFIKSPAVQSRIEDMQSGTTNQVELSKTEILKAAILLPPLSEQRRIVSKLDALSARTSLARNRLEAVLGLVERFRQSVIDAAFAQFELTSPLINLVDQDTGIPYGIVQTGDHYEDGIPTVRAGDIKGFRLLEEGLKRVRPEVADQYGRTKLKGGEVLIAIRGSIGETCVVPPTMAGNNISREVALIPVSKDADAAFVMYFLRSAQAAGYIKENIKGVAQTGINLRDLKRLPCPNMNLRHQSATVRKIESAFVKVDRLAADATKALNLNERLHERILEKAFSGELVPQDPNDESASAMLDRIREARANAPKPKSQPRKPLIMKKRPNLASLLDAWPLAGMTFEELRLQASGTYDQVKEELFELMTGDQPKIRQKFDSTEKTMRLMKVGS